MDSNLWRGRWPGVQWKGGGGEMTMWSWKCDMETCIQELTSEGPSWPLAHASPLARWPSPSTQQTLTPSQPYQHNDTHGPPLTANWRSAHEGLDLSFMVIQLGCEVLHMHALEQPGLLESEHAVWVLELKAWATWLNMHWRSALLVHALHLDGGVRVTLQQCHSFNQRYSEWGELIGYEHTNTLMQWLSSEIKLRSVYCISWTI